MCNELFGRLSKVAWGQIYRLEKEGDVLSDEISEVTQITDIQIQLLKDLATEIWIISVKARTIKWSNK